MQSFEIRLIEDINVLGPRASEWDALLKRSATRTVFQTMEWQRSWWNAFGADARLLVLIAEEAGRMVAIAPLMVSVQRLMGRKRRVVEFIGTHAADYCDFIAEPARRPAVYALLGWLVDHARSWDLLHLINIAETSPLLEALPRAFEAHAYATDLQPLYKCPTYAFGDPEADRRLVNKSGIRQHLNQLRKQGQVEFKRYGTAAEMDACLEPFFQQHIDRWAGTDTPSFFLDERQRMFYRELVRLLAPKGWIAFSAVLFKEVPIAFHFGFEYDGRLYVIKPTFNAQYSKYAPGMVHIKYLAEHAMQRGASELDFTTGEEPYKFRFSNRVRLNYAARVHAPSMFYGVDRALAYAKALAKRSRLLHRLGKSVVKPLLGNALQRMGL
jgi:CelD/BcsL family acetyltransferase involved in cellulose biosynthesis